MRKYWLLMRHFDYAMNQLRWPKPFDSNDGVIDVGCDSHSLFMARQRLDMYVSETIYAIKKRPPNVAYARQNWSGVFYCRKHKMRAIWHSLCYVDNDM